MRHYSLWMKLTYVYIFPGDIEILGWCPTGLVLPYGEKVNF